MPRTYICGDNALTLIDKLSQYDVVWDSPSKDASGSMPLGNGDLALNAWVEESGDLILLLAKGDAWDETCQLLKLGRVRIKCLSQPFDPSMRFRQRHNPRGGVIEILIDRVTLKIWVDANAPIIRVEAQSDKPFNLVATSEIWRKENREIKPQTGDIFCNLTGKPLYHTVISPDVVLPTKNNRIAWCHHNAAREHDGFAINMKLQGLGELIEQMPHPLLHRTFGAAMEGAGLKAVGDVTLQSIEPAKRHELRIHALTQHPSTVEQWHEAISKQMSAAQEAKTAWRQHLAWWEAFWERSWLIVQSVADSANAFQITRAYLLQRFMNACAGRSEFPIKHNGSLFSVGRGDDPDYRRWGGPGFWFMNQRLVYWPMLTSGDFDLIRPWLSMYRDTLALQRHRAQTYFKHEGAHYPETIMFWGAEVSAHYGWIPFEDRARPEAECPYLTYYWSGGIELTLILLEHFEHTGDATFANEFLIPIATDVLKFFDQHYPRNAAGKIEFTPGQALETWHEATNPTPEIAGLRYVLARLCESVRQMASPETLAAWLRLLSELPDIPVGEKDGTRVILPAEKFEKLKNKENPELYGVFPYRLFGIDKPDLQLTRDTFEKRLHKSHNCWSQDDIQMALLGLTEQAKANLTARAASEAHSDSRFPAFFNAFNDWVPDIDHAGVLQIALQKMLMQCDGRKIILLPAWPTDWDVDFKLHAPYQTVLEGSVRNGAIANLKVSPPDRAADVVVWKQEQTT